MRYLLLSLLLIGCATPCGSIEKTPTGVIMKANTKSIIKYKDSEIDVTFDSKGQPLIALDIPDVKVN